MNAKAENSCAMRRAPSAEQNWASKVPPENLKKILKSEKSYRKVEGVLNSRRGGNKVHESGKCFWIGDKKLTIKTDYETVWKTF